MNPSAYFRRAALAVLPATVLLAACSKTDTPAPTPAVDQGRVLISHAAAAANTQITAFANDQQVAQLNYGQSTAYTNVNAGNATIRINNGSAVVSTQTVAVAKGQNYSVFAYSPTATIGSASLLAIPDDLTAPAAGTAKVRLVHLGVGAATPVRLSIPAATPTGTPNDLTTDVAFGTASAFVVVNAGALSLSVTPAAAPRTPVVAMVGDGTGAGTGSKTFESGKIYTVVVRGIAGSGVPAAQQLQAVIIANN
ncbi:DUF4397 domain-containing protein [Hymenobacter sp. DH14]|uniref:DUF4397 domain-containing protein n=1 Tax=Hymenobacter cyanobacteriorum TaxID=2926463 RepID=A0A9X1VHS2_9BACT|nr:DUF4397 domain-containing protein [Hymenobacter cyanobacteriorum]MCI1188522.1 DUF4397 domain-containing protein [Hymenobacter cyanobacteriorum]